MSGARPSIDSMSVYRIAGSWLFQGVTSDVLTGNGRGVSAPRGRQQRPLRRNRFLVVYGFVLATLAVVALAVGALALHNGAAAQQDIRDEERQQTKCARALVIATGITPQRKSLMDDLNACYASNGRPLASSSNP